jgi:hypothetical protein
MAESQEDLREIALKRLKKRREFRTHLFVYVLVNALLWGIWVVAGVTGDFGFPWPVFVTGGWGVGLLFDARETYGQEPVTEQDVQAEIERLKQQR